MNENEIPLSIEQISPDANKQLLVGDVFYGSVTLSNELSDAKPGFLETLKAGSLEWGDGRLLSHESEKLENGQIVHKFSFTCYKAAPCKFPSITFSDKEGKTVATSTEVTMNYSAVEQSKEKEVPIYAPISLGIPTHVQVLIGLAAVVVAIAVFWCVKIIINKYFRNFNSTESAAPLAPPFEELTTSLKNLAAKDYLSNAHYKPYYFTISETLKRYLGRKFEFNAEELTTSELMGALNNRYSLDAEERLKWRELFNELDLVKFTDNQPSINDAQSLMERSLDIARKTEKIENDVQES